MTSLNPVPQIARELSIGEASVAAVIGLLADSNTVPFIARYRKEVTGNLDEVQIRAIEERRTYLVELDERRTAVLASIEEQGKLTDELRAQIEACTTKAILEDLYRPYKKKRRTRAMIARERGLEQLAQRMVDQPAQGDPRAEAQVFVDPEKEVPDVDAALAGARDIVAEVLSERADLRKALRQLFAESGDVVSIAIPETTTGKPTKFELYYDFREMAKTIPSHRYLAVRRGEVEGFLRVTIEVDPERGAAVVREHAGIQRGSPWAGELEAAVNDSYERLLFPSLSNELRSDLKDRSDNAAVEVFADNLRNLLMAAPLGGEPVLGIDPGLRTGCKVAAVDATGKFLVNTTLYLVKGDGAVANARGELGKLVAHFKPRAIAVGNGTGGRETEAFVREVLREANKDAPGGDAPGNGDGATSGDDRGANPYVVLVNEAGASVYSASDVAREEFPDLDLTVRGAISIARRLQDPLAELVKIDPKAIGVGQYQHDVHQPLLRRKLDEVVESCVNQVGVELNTASAPLLSRVAGLSKTVAGRIVAHREQHGAFASREALLEVSGLGPRAYQQAAGFLRIREGAHPLDASAVHPERYALVERMANDAGVDLADLVGNREATRALDLKKYVDNGGTGDGVGEPTLRDILAELEKPGRDPRDEFSPPQFRDDVSTLEDLKPGMSLEGVVTNVTAFGAFVDVGVHQDGLVHISKLADRFVSDPNEVVRVGQKLKVRVLEVDLDRRRISLTARSDDAPTVARSQKRAEGDAPAATGARPQQRAEGGAPSSDRRPPRGKPEDGGRRHQERGRDGGGHARQDRGRDGGGRPQQDRGREGGFKNNPFANLGRPKS